MMSLTENVNNSNNNPDSQEISEIAKSFIALCNPWLSLLNHGLLTDYLRP